MYKHLLNKHSIVVFPKHYFTIDGPNHLMLLDIKFKCKVILLDIKELRLMSNNIVLSL